MPAFKTSPDPPYEHHDIIPDGFVVFHGLLPAQCLCEIAGERHRLIVMPEEKSEAQIEWHNNKDGGGGVITACGQRVIFLHRQADFSLVWKQEATLLWFHVNDDMLRWRDTAGKHLGKAGHSPLWELARHDCAIMGLIRQFMAGDRSQSPVFPVDYFEHTGASLTFLLIDALAHEKESKAAPATLDAEQLRRILDHIDKNLDDKIEAGTLAGVARLSVTHFKRLFKATTGMTAGDYISRERIHKAQALLRQGDMTVADVAACCGFCDQGYMDRCFRRFCRCSPRDFLPKGRIVRKNGPDVQAKPGKTGHNGGTF